MRRIISAVLVYCLLHTSTYAAVADLQSLSPATTSHTASHVNYGKLDPRIPDATTVSISADTSSKMLDIPHRPKAKHSPAFFMTMAGIAAVVFTGMWWKIQTPSVVKTDVCFHHQSRDHISHLQQKNDHRWNGNMPLTAGIQDWLNANTAVMTSLGEIAHDLRHGDHEHVGEKWSKTQSTLYNVLHNHGVEHLGPRSIACDINLGDGTTPDRISECDHRKPPQRLESETFKDGVGARLWLHPDRNRRLLARNIDLIAKPLTGDQLYPNPVQSLNIESKEAKYDSRRKLLQTGNTLPLPQAIQDTVNDREDVRVLLATIRETLRQWDPSTAKITELNALIKSIFEAHGFVMTGDVHCGFVLDNGGVMLSDCALASSGRADRSFAAQTALEKVTFLQSADNPVKVDGVEIETNVLPAQEALPFVLQRAANALHTELDQLRQDRCSVDDRSNVIAVQKVVKDALETPNVALSTDMACDVTIGNGGITKIRCAPGVAPESAVCGTYNGTFKTEGRVWVTPNGGFVVSANRNWNRTKTIERPHAPSPERSESLTLKRTHTPNLSQTTPPQYTPSPSLPAPQNTTTRIYWIRQRSEQVNLPSTVWGADLDPITGIAGEPWVFLTEPDVMLPCAIYYEAKNGFFYWSEGTSGGSGSNLYVAKVNQTINKRATLHSKALLDNSENSCGSIFVDNQLEMLYWQNSNSGFITSPINSLHPSTTPLNIRKWYLGGDIGMLSAVFSTVSFKSKWIVFGGYNINDLNTGNIQTYPMQNITRFLNPPVFKGSCRGLFFHEFSKKLYFTGSQLDVSGIYSADIKNPTTLIFANISLVYNSTNRTVLDAGNGFPSTIVINSN